MECVDVKFKSAECSYPQFQINNFCDMRRGSTYIIAVDTWTTRYFTFVSNIFASYMLVLLEQNKRWITVSKIGIQFYFRESIHDEFYSCIIKRLFLSFDLTHTKNISVELSVIIFFMKYWSQLTTIESSYAIIRPCIKNIRDQFLYFENSVSESWRFKHI